MKTKIIHASNKLYSICFKRCRFIIPLLFIIFINPVYSQWRGTCDYNSCPHQYLSGGYTQDFSTESACLAQINITKSSAICIACTCTNISVTVTGNAPGQQNVPQINLNGILNGNAFFSGSEIT